MTFLENLKAYVGFTDESSAALAAFHETAQPHFTWIIDDFYATIEAHPDASAAITGGKEQIERLKQTLVRWLDTMLRGPHDEAYFHMRARIGRVHVRINLPQAYMFTAMDRIRVHVLDVARDTFAKDQAQLKATSTALHQILDLELAIMLETYREDLVARNRTTERLSTIGQLAAGIGHELRNPLGVIESSVFLMRQQMTAASITDAKLTKHLDKIAAEVKRSSKTITDILELARNKPPRRQRVPVSTLAEAALEVANPPSTVTVTVTAPGDATVDGDPNELRQVLVNLITNSAQAMNGTGHIWLEARREAKGTVIVLRDDGPGVPAEVRHRIFEALFTTKAKGSGLGLALCRRIAEAHGGTIALEPGTDGGARFVLTIPDALETGASS